MGQRHDKRTNRAFYDARPPGERLRFETEPSKLHTAELLVPWIAPFCRPGARIIDIAGGAGSYASKLARGRPMTVIGIDISEAMVRERTEDPLLSQNAVADMEGLPFGAERFDAAMFVACLHHVPDPLPALREAWRVLGPEGRLFIMEPCSLRAWRKGGLPTEEAHEFRISLPWLVDKVQEAGFRLEEVRGRRLAMRFLGRLAASPSLRMFHVGDALDRVFGRIPGLQRFGSLVFLRARK